MLRDWLLASRVGIWMVGWGSDPRLDAAYLPEGSKGAWAMRDDAYVRRMYVPADRSGPYGLPWMILYPNFLSGSTRGIQALW